MPKDNIDAVSIASNPDVITPPASYRIVGNDANSPGSQAVINNNIESINSFVAAQRQMVNLSGLDQHKAATQTPDLDMVYLNQFGQERIELTPYVTQPANSEPSQPESSIPPAPQPGNPQLPGIDIPSLYLLVLYGQNQWAAFYMSLLPQAVIVQYGRSAISTWVPTGTNMVRVIQLQYDGSRSYIMAGVDLSDTAAPSTTYKLYSNTLSPAATTLQTSCIPAPLTTGTAWAGQPPMPMMTVVRGGMIYTTNDAISIAPVTYEPNITQTSTINTDPWTIDEQGNYYYLFAWHLSTPIMADETIFYYNSQIDEQFQFLNFMPASVPIRLGLEFADSRKQLVGGQIVQMEDSSGNSSTAVFPYWPGPGRASPPLNGVLDANVPNRTDYPYNWSFFVGGASIDYTPLYTDPSNSLIPYYLQNFYFYNRNTANANTHAIQAYGVQITGTLTIATLAQLNVSVSPQIGESDAAALAALAASGPGVATIEDYSSQVMWPTFHPGAGVTVSPVTFTAIHQANYTGTASTFVGRTRNDYYKFVFQDKTIETYMGVGVINSGTGFTYPDGILPVTDPTTPNAVYIHPFPFNLPEQLSGPIRGYISYRDPDSGNYFTETPYAKYQSMAPDSFVPWLHVSNDQHYAQGFDIDDTRYLWLDGIDFMSLLTGILTLPDGSSIATMDVKGVFMDISLQACQNL